MTYLLTKKALIPLIMTSLILITLICVIIIITRSETDKEEDAKYFSKAAVASDVGKCSDIGVEILKKGGTAVDSAIATLFCQGTINMQSSGIGGGLFMVVYNKTLGKAWFYNGREKAPANSTRDMFVNKTQASKKGIKKRVQYNFV